MMTVDGVGLLNCASTFLFKDDAMFLERVVPTLGALGVAGLLALVAPNAFATGNTGLYLGGGVGQTHGDGNFDDEAEHWKLVGGYNFGWLPFLDVGAELAYVNADTLDGEANGHSASLDVESVQATGVLGWSQGPLASMPRRAWPIGTPSGTAVVSAATSPALIPSMVWGRDSACSA